MKEGGGYIKQCICWYCCYKKKRSEWGYHALCCQVDDFRELSNSADNRIFSVSRSSHIRLRRLTVSKFALDKVVEPGWFLTTEENMDEKGAKRLLAVREFESFNIELFAPGITEFAGSDVLAIEEPTSRLLISTWSARVLAVSSLSSRWTWRRKVQFSSWTSDSRSTNA